MAKESTCVFCGSKSYGKGNCPFSSFSNKLHVHTGDSTKCSFCGSSRVIGPGCPHSPSGKHMAGANFFNNMVQESFITAYIMKRLSEPICMTEAFKRGIIDLNGALLKHPETMEEQMAYSNVDKYLFKLRNLLGNKVDILNNSKLLEAAIKISDIPIELYEKEIELKEQFRILARNFKETVDNAEKTGLPITIIEKLILEEFSK